MIDLHLHTTASDGRLSPGELVEQAAAAGLHVMAVTDHDTTAAVPDVQALARARGIDAISGIEITAIDAGRDVHVLGYFIDPAHAGLAAFLQRQRETRIARVEAIGRRLASLGVPIDLEGLLASARQQSGSFDWPARRSPARWWTPATWPSYARGLRSLAGPGPSRLRAAAGCRLGAGHRGHS